MRHDSTRTASLLSSIPVTSANITSRFKGTRKSADNYAGGTADEMSIALSSQERTGGTYSSSNFLWDQCASECSQYRIYYSSNLFSSALFLTNDEDKRGRLTVQPDRQLEQQETKEPRLFPGRDHAPCQRKRRDQEDCCTHFAMPPD